MAISIAVLDCDLLLHGRGHKTLDRFDLESVSDEFLVAHFGFPRDFILYLVEILREVRAFGPPALQCAHCKATGWDYLYAVCEGSLQTHPAVQSHQPRGSSVGRSRLLHVGLLPDVHGRHNRDQPSIHVQMSVPCDQSAGGKGTAVHHFQNVRSYSLLWPPAILFLLFCS